MNIAYPFWSDLTTKQFADLAASPDVARLVAVLPVAATEQHGPHLPLNVDSLLVDGVIKAALPHMGWGKAGEPAAADAVPALFLPTQKISLSTEHLGFAGTLTLSPQTVMALWMEIGASVARTGIKKLVLLNSHGGNVGLMDVVARELRTAHNLIVYHTSWYNLPLGDAANLFSADEHRFGVHAGDIETSMMLALRPDLVDMTLAKNFHSTSQDRAKTYPVLGNGKSAKLGWQMQDYNASGAAGNAAQATADKGRALLKSAGLQLAKLLAEVSDLPLSTIKI
ncbi:MAG: creatininase family protein [Cytophagales bacterium]|nr:creatininase family protein [Cytophagales bacterium]